MESNLVELFKAERVEHKEMFLNWLAKNYCNVLCMKIRQNSSDNCEVPCLLSEHGKLKQ
jgi:hypothetical protein